MINLGVGLENSRRLWSLWDIMKPFDAVSFLHIRGWLGWYDVFKEGPSMGLPARWLKRLVPELRGLGGEPQSVILDSDRIKFEEIYRATKELCAYHQLSASRATAQKMMERLKDPDSTYKTLYDLAGELEGRLTDEMNERKFLSLNLEETEYFENPRKGWEEIISRFPGAVNDIEEAENVSPFLVTQLLYFIPFRW